MRITEAQFAQLQQWGTPGAKPAPPPSKYRNRAQVIDGIRFDSKLEARCYEGLKLRQAAGDVLWFTRQVSFRLEGGVKYRADFLAVLPDGVEVIDAKGFETQSSKNKRKQMLERYGITVILWRAA